MRIKVLKTRGLAVLIAGLACISDVSGQEDKVPTPESLLKSMRQRAEKGDAESQWVLGAAYDLGRLVPQNDAEAVRWYRKAAEQGNALGQANLGKMYYEGRGVMRDYAEAARWYRKGAEQGHAYSQFHLGQMYGQGQGVPQDYVEAHMWANLAALGTSSYENMEFADLREEVAKKMTPEQIAEAERRAREWKPRKVQQSKTPPSKTSTRK